jgi:hypothetical protein
VLTDTPMPGTDLIELIWPNNAIDNRFLEVTIKGRDATGGFNTITGLPESDIFYFGNQIGDDFTAYPGFFNTNTTDQINARNNQGVAISVTNPYDFNRDAFVNSTDQIIARNNQGFLPAISISSPPPAPEALDGDASIAAVVSAIAAPELESPADSTDAPIVSEPAGAEPNREAVFSLTAQTTRGHDPRGVVELISDEVDDILGLDEELLDALAAMRG